MTSPITYEFKIIQRIKELVGSNSNRVLVGIGDDTAITVPPIGNLLVTTDCLVDGTHGDFSYMTAREWGHKALAVNLSDLAAMGGNPLYAVVSMGLTLKTDEAFVLEFYDGLLGLANTFSVDVVGGNLTRSDTFFASLTLFGEAKEPILRKGSKVGDLLAVSGKLGSSHGGYLSLKKWGIKAKNLFPELTKQHLEHMPRIHESLALRKIGGATSMIDVSDGLSSELHHLSKSSLVGFLVYEEKIPIALESWRLAKELGENVLDWAWSGGEDYELLFTLSEESAKKVPDIVTVIGEVRPLNEGVKKLSAGKALPIDAKGWNHF